MSRCEKGLVWNGLGEPTVSTAADWEEEAKSEIWGSADQGTWQGS